MDQDLLREIQHFVAADAIGSSAVRGQPPSTKRIMTDGLKDLPLNQIPLTNPVDFGAWMNEITADLVSVLPAREGTSAWGIARKGLNLFLRACVYNHYLRREYGLDALEPWLEVPLDNKVADGLRKAAKRAGRRLPRWRFICHLKAADSLVFQGFAMELAAERGLPARVFLDHGFWLLKKPHSAPAR